MEYRYKAKSIGGKIIEGRVVSDDLSNLIHDLELRDYFIYELKPKKITYSLPNKKNSKLSDEALYIFSSKLKTSLQGGISIKNSVELILENENNKYKKSILENIINDFDLGISFSKSLDNSRLFPWFYINMIIVGESTGDLALSVDKLTSYYYEKYIRRNKLISNLIYPSILFISFFLTLIFTFIYIIPGYISFFDSNGIERPKILSRLMDFKLTLSDKKIVILLGLLFLVFILKTMFKNHKFNKVLFKIPFLGDILKENYYINIFQNLQILTSGGISLIQALDISKNSIDNISIKYLLNDLINDLNMGVDLNTGLRKSNFFNNYINSIIEIGENSGNLNESYLNIIKYTKEKLDTKLDLYVLMIEPIALILISIFVALILYIIIIPMMEVSNSIF